MFLKDSCVLVLISLFQPETLFWAPLLVVPLFLSNVITLSSFVHQGGRSNPAQISFNLVLPSNALGYGEGIQPVKEQVSDAPIQGGHEHPSALPSPCRQGGWHSALRHPSEGLACQLESPFWGATFVQVVLQVAGTCLAEFIGLEKSLNSSRKAVQGRSGGEAFKGTLTNRTCPLKWEL